MLSANNVALYLLTKQDTDSGDVITNLKLQKLLYYSQGYHLAIKDKPLFSERIMAWLHGPVVVEVYDLYKDFGSDAIAVSEEFDINTIPNEQLSLIDEIYEEYGQFSAWKLRNMTHEEAPWKKTDQNKEISRQLMSDFFKTQLVD